jgi:DNA adenine methylase
MIFRYPGGKSKKSVREKIFSHFPEDYYEYRETMVGGGGIFFHVPTNKKRWINDLDTNLISVYSALKEDSKKFIQNCRNISPICKNENLTSARSGGKNLYSLRLKKVFDKFVEDTKSDPALRYFFIHRTVWAGRVRYDLKSRMYFSNPTGWNIVKTNKLEKAAKILEETKVTSTNYEELLFQDGKDVLIYIDPPYVCNTELSNSSRLYNHNFELEDHARLSENLKKCKHKFILSYDNNDYIKKLYKNFNVIEEQWTYCGTSSANGINAKKQKGKELIIKNY